MFARLSAIPVGAAKAAGRLLRRVARLAVISVVVAAVVLVLDIVLLRDTRRDNSSR